MDAVDPIRIAPRIEPVIIRPHEGARMDDHSHEHAQREDTYEFRDGTESDESEKPPTDEPPPEDHLDLRC